MFALKKQAGDLLGVAVFNDLVSPPRVSRYFTFTQRQNRKLRQGWLTVSASQKKMIDSGPLPPPSQKQEVRRENNLRQFIYKVINAWNNCQATGSTTRQEELERISQ